MLCSQRVFPRDKAVSEKNLQGVCKPYECLEMDTHAPEPVVIWHIDEVFINALNTQWYVWCGVDQKSRCWAIHLSLYRDMKSAIAALRIAKEFAEQRPDSEG